MIRIIISLILINIIFCSAESCENEEDQSKCQNHEVEYDGFSCFKFKNEDFDLSEPIKYGCFSFPDDPNLQKAFLNFYFGMAKEIFSGFSGFLFDEEGEQLQNLNFQSDKQSYNKGDIVSIKYSKFTESDKNILEGKNTCGYLFYGRFIEDLFSYMEKNYVGYRGYPNITDKNKCFRATQFPELKDLVDCGFAEIKYLVGGKEYKINTCFYIPNDKMPEQIGAFLKDNFIDDLLEGEEGLSSIFINIEGPEERRRLSSPTYEVVVEDKNGKKVRYKTGSTGIEVISRGKSNILKFNLILLLSLFLLNL